MIKSVAIVFTNILEVIISTYCSCTTLKIIVSSLQKQELFFWFLLFLCESDILGETSFWPRCLCSIFDSLTHDHQWDWDGNGSGLRASLSSSFHLLSPLTKESISTNNQGMAIGVQIKQVTSFESDTCTCTKNKNKRKSEEDSSSFSSKRQKQ